MLLNVSDPVGPENDEWLVQLSQSASLVIAAWGNHGCYLNRSESVKRLCGNLHVMKLNGSGEPAHPLYLPAYLTPQRWL